MEKPRYFDDMLPYLSQDTKGRIEEIEKELQDLISLKSSNRLSSEDIEDVSDNYQYHLEWNYAISDLTDELDCLKYQQYLDSKKVKEVFLLNAFSLQMLKGDAIVRFTEVSSDEIFTIGDCETDPSFDDSGEFDWGEFEPNMFLKPGIKSAIGHHDTANILGVPMNRINVALEKGDTAFVAQLQGGRLPEGSTTLPEGFSFKFIEVEVL